MSGCDRPSYTLNLAVGTEAWDLTQGSVTGALNDPTGPLAARGFAEFCCKPPTIVNAEIGYGGTGFPGTILELAELFYENLSDKLTQTVRVWAQADAELQNGMWAEFTKIAFQPGPALALCNYIYELRFDFATSTLVPFFGPVKRSTYTPIFGRGPEIPFAFRGLSDQASYVDAPWAASTTYQHYTPIPPDTPDDTPPIDRYSTYDRVRIGYRRNGSDTVLRDFDERWFDPALTPARRFFTVGVSLDDILDRSKSSVTCGVLTAGGTFGASVPRAVFDGPSGPDLTRAAAIEILSSSGPTGTAGLRFMGINGWGTTIERGKNYTATLPELPTGADNQRYSAHYSAGSATGPVTSSEIGDAIARPDLVSEWQNLIPSGNNWHASALVPAGSPLASPGATHSLRIDFDPEVGTPGESVVFRDKQGAVPRGADLVLGVTRQSVVWMLTQSSLTLSPSFGGRPLAPNTWAYFSTTPDATYQKSITEPAFDDLHRFYPLGSDLTESKNVWNAARTEPSVPGDYRAAYTYQHFFQVFASAGRVFDTSNSRGPLVIPVADSGMTTRDYDTWSRTTWTVSKSNGAQIFLFVRFRTKWTLTSVKGYRREMETVSETESTITLTPTGEVETVIDLSGSDVAYAQEGIMTVAISIPEDQVAALESGAEATATVSGIVLSGVPDAGGFSATARVTVT